MPILARFLTILAALGLAIPASAQTLDARLEEFSAVSLEPGQYRWQPQAATSGAIEIVVSVTLQLAYVFRGGTMIGVASVSTGAPGHDTPTGTFRILQKARHHRSNLYSNAPMPFMQRLTWDGIALHAGTNPGYPDSHGCIRLPTAFARELFAVTRMGGRVHVTDEAPTPSEAVELLRGSATLG